MKNYYLGIKVILSFFLCCYSSHSLAIFESASWISSGGKDYDSSGNPRYNLHLSKEADIIIELKSSVDTYLYLLDRNNNLLDFNDDGGVGYNSMISQHLQAGEYTVVAATYRTQESGIFELTSRHKGLPDSDSRVLIRNISLGGCITSRQIFPCKEYTRAFKFVSSGVYYQIQYAKNNNCVVYEPDSLVSLETCSSSDGQKWFIYLENGKISFRPKISTRKALSPYSMIGEWFLLALDDEYSTGHAKEEQLWELIDK